jgi:type IV pilus biogenesis protein CpaD/CtpE
MEKRTKTLKNTLLVLTSVVTLLLAGCANKDSEMVDKVGKYDVTGEVVTHQTQAGVPILDSRPSQDGEGEEES